MAKLYRVKTCVVDIQRSVCAPTSINVSSSKRREKLDKVTNNDMEPQDVYYSKAEYVETVSKRNRNRWIWQWQKRIHLTSSFIFLSFDFDVFQASGNKVSRQTVLCGSQNIVLHGKVIVQSDAIIRGDLANVRTGRYCIISKNAIIRPPFKKFSRGLVIDRFDQFVIDTLTLYIFVRLVSSALPSSLWRWATTFS